MVTIARTVFQSFKRFSHISKYVSYISDVFSSSLLLSVFPSLLAFILNIHMSVYFIFDLRSFLFFYLPLFSIIFTYFHIFPQTFLLFSHIGYVRICSVMFAYGRYGQRLVFTAFSLAFLLNLLLFALCSFYFFWT